MDTEALSICPVTSRELSGDLGGAVAVGVISVSDLKFVLNSTDNLQMLGRSVKEFIAWRSIHLASNTDEAPHADEAHSQQRFSVVSVDASESLYVLASRLVSTKLRRVFLSSDELGRIVGSVASQDILVEVQDTLRESSALGRKVPRPDSPMKPSSPIASRHSHDEA